jgi:DNA mismatch endonuclease (patch repair protein)
MVQPKTNAAFWKNKRETNVQRDREQLARLDKAGWQSLVVWECETRDVPVLQQKLSRFLEGDRPEERAD